MSELYLAQCLMQTKSSIHVSNIYFFTMDGAANCNSTSILHVKKRETGLLRRREHMSNM